MTDKTVDKAHAPFLALAYNLVFNPHVKKTFKEKPFDVLDAFGIDSEDQEQLTGDEAQSFLLHKIEEDVQNNVEQEAIIPNHELWWNCPTLFATSTVLTNGTVSDKFQKTQEYRDLVFDVFGLDSKYVRTALSKERPEMSVVATQIFQELNHIVDEDFNEMK